MIATDPRPLIVGLGCRVPGARTPRQMWDILANERCVIGDADDRLFDPAFYLDSHRTRPGKSYSFRAGQIDDLYAFDPKFFGISPRAATEMDPQQRLMLQTVWEAVEDAGLDISQLAGDRTGVMVGTSYLEMLPKYYLDPARGGSNFVLGNTLSVIANRISSVFDFGGPSYAVDTACSSALYALHQGAEAIRSGQIDTAIIGGVHVVRTPGGFVGFSQARMLSPSGFCRSFDAGADGYVRSEACISVVLMHPDKAATLQPRVRARLLASGVNSDGRVSPITVPASVRQADLIRDVIQQSGIDPDALHFYEAHGTGTAVGDPIEAVGLGNALGQLRRAPLPIGSAKSNFGHAEPASGLVGLAKLLLAMEHRHLPASLHFSTPNPEIAFDDLNLEVAATSVPLPKVGAIYAGISSFGFGGTNAAALLASEAPHPARISLSAAPPQSPPWLLLSAASEPALHRLARRWADQLDQTPRATWPVLTASAARRAGLRHRIALALTDGAPDLLRNEKLGADTIGFSDAKTAFAFPGNGAQHATSGREAYARSPAFRAAFDEVASAFATLGVPNLTQTLAADDLDVQFASPQVAQPILFASQVAQARALMAAGVQPDLLIGHSLGEIAALHIAGAFDLADAAKIIFRRSARFEALRGAGGMVTIAASEADVTQLLGGFSDDLSIAAINSPNSVTVTGPNALLDRLDKVTLHGKRVPMVRLGVEVPYHSAALDALEQAFRADLDDISFQSLRLPVVSAVHARLLRFNEVGTEYMWRNSRAPVRFLGAVSAACKSAPCLMLEIAPKPVLAANLRDCARFAGLAVDHFAPPIDAASDQGAAQLWQRGANVDTASITGTLTGPSLPVPMYPWDEQDYFAPSSPDGMDYWGEHSAGILAGRRIDRDGPSWIAEFTPTAPAWVKDHAVAGKIILPATALFEIALSAGTTLWPDQPIEVAHFDILAPAEVKGEGLRIRTEIDATSGRLTMRMRTRLADGLWQDLGRGQVQPASRTPKSTLPKPGAWPDDQGNFYGDLRRTGLDYGPAFQRLEAVKKGRGQAWICKLSIAEAEQGFCLDPMDLDAVFHSLAPMIRDQVPSVEALLDAGHVFVPNRVGRLTWACTGRRVRFAKVSLVRQRQTSLALDIALYDAERRVVATLVGLELALSALDAAPRLQASQWQRRLPRWRAANAPVQWPHGWRNPAGALQKLGFSRQTTLTESTALLGAVRTALATGAQTETNLATLMREHPALVNDARVMLAHQRKDAAFAIAQVSASQRAIWQQIEQLIRQLAKTWRANQRMNVALVGLIDPAVAQRLSAIERIDDIVLWHPDEAGRSYLTASLPPRLHPHVMAKLRTGHADVIMTGGTGRNGPELEALAAAGAMLFDLDLALDDAATDGTTWFTTARDLNLSLKARRCGAPPDLPAVRLNNGGSAQTVLPAALISDAADAVPTLVHTHEAAETASAGLTRLIMTIKRLYHRPPARLVVLAVNQGGADFEALARGAASILRSLKNEYPDTAASLIAISVPPSEKLWPALLAAGVEDPVLYVSGTDVRTERVIPLPPASMSGPSVALSVGSQRGAYIWRSANRRKPKRDELEVEIAATGLNFRDVLWAQGRLPDRLFDLGSSLPGMGMEWAGRVLRTGADAPIAVGTAVMGFGAAAFRRHLTLPADAVLPVPDGVDLSSAATIPVAFATTWDALVNVARVTAADTLLLHGGAGGVGLAALQIAKRAGATVIATAGTEDKRKLVRAMGADHVLDSRDLAFADAVMNLTKGRGVSVVLNSLAGAAMQRSLACLAPFGRFIELGKRDFLEGTALNMRPLQRSLSYHAYDLDQRLAHDPGGVRKTMRQLGKAFTAQELRPLPVTTFEGGAIEDAVHHMQGAHHVGKIVVEPPKPAARPKARVISGTWVLIGGNGGVGLSLARALRQSGAGDVHLVSRSGDVPVGSGPEADWAKSDPDVHLHACDASDPDALGAVFDRIAAPIQGVVHCAALLRDRLIKDLDPVETRQVIDAKLGVAEALGDVLDARDFCPRHVLFLSSIAAYLGNPGQIAYAASNVALEAIAAKRRAQGLSGAVLALGAIEDRGLLARDTAKAAKLANMRGVGFLTAAHAVDAILAALRFPEDRDTLHAPMHWADLSVALPALSQTGFDRVISDEDRRRQPQEDLAKDLRALDWGKALARVEKVLVEIFARILRLPPDQFDPRRPITRAGIDSLMAMELRLEVEQRFGVGLPVSALSETATTRDMALSLLRTVRKENSDI